MVYKCFDKNTGSKVGGARVNVDTNHGLKKSKEGVYSRFKDNIWGADSAEMGSFCSKYRGAKYLSSVMDVFTKYVWVKPLKDKKAKTVLHGFIEEVRESKRKPNKLCFDQGKEFYNSFIQKYLDDNDILMNSSHNEGKSVAAEGSIKTLKPKIYNNMTGNDNKFYLV